MQSTAASHSGGRPADEKQGADGEFTHLHTYCTNTYSAAPGRGNFSLVNNHYEMASREAYGATCPA